MLAFLALALLLTWRAPLAQIAPPAPGRFDHAAVLRGSALAKLGDCSVCHTRQGGAPFAGGRPLPMPFGLIYASNITPDARMGIGRWSQPAFVRAMRHGLARNGAQLYPAFPYDHFSAATDQDLSDLYAFLMTRAPDPARKPADRLIPPLGFRPLLAGWKLLFFRPHVTSPTAGRSAEWNRGRYLAEGLAHCGACHSPRGVLGAENAARPYAGGWAEGWYAPPLTAASPASRRWTVKDLFIYLRTGLSAHHAAAAGPMGEVTRELSDAPAADVHAIAVYIASKLGAAKAAKAQQPLDREAAAREAEPQGTMLFAGACATCHARGAGMTLQGRPNLTLGTPLWEDSPRDTLQIVLQGLRPPVGRAGPYMPAFGDALTDAQAAQLAAYLRARYTDRPPWSELEREARAARKEATP